MRKLLAMFIIILSVNSSASASERFISFPSIGQCTGTYVRYRADPDTEAEILGRLNAPERVVVFGQTATNGEIWYEIGNPHGQDSAFIFGKYIRPVFNETSQHSELYKLIFDILMEYGLTEEADYYEGPEVIRKYNSHGGLVKVEAWQDECTFGDINIGDNTSKIKEILGEPDVKHETEWEYKLENFCVTFIVKNGKITRMIYEE